MTDKQIIYEFLSQNKYMSLATTSLDGKPEVATVEYLVDGDQLIINTFIYYRKYQNLVDNPQIACVITVDDEKTLQFDARAELLEGEAAAQARQKLMEFDPGFADFFDDDETRFFRITPTWLRLRDYTQQPLKTTEYKV